MHGNQIRISVIVPIYNVGMYLRRCLDSLIGQDYKNLEIILATDGPEDCDNICKEYIQKCPSIKIIWHPGSYGKACNTGIRIASGDYVGIVESDDWCRLDMFGKLADAALRTKADIVKSGFTEIDNSGKQIKKYFFKKLNFFNVEEKPFILGFQPSVWSAIYRKKFLIDNNIYFIEKKMPFVDAPFTYTSFLNAKLITAVPECLYFYYLGNQNQSVKNPKAAFAGIEAEFSFYKNFNNFNTSSEVLIELLKASEDHLKWDRRLLIQAEDIVKFDASCKEFWQYILQKFKDVPISKRLNAERIPTGVIDNSIFEWVYQNGKRKFKFFGKTLFSYHIN